MNFAFLTSIIYLTIGVLLFLLGLLIYREHPSQRVNRVTAVMIFLAAIAPIMGAFGLMIFKINAQLKLDLEILRRIFLLWELFFPQLLYFSLIFPEERKIVKDFPKIVYFIFIPHIFHFFVILIFRTPESILSLINIPQTDTAIDAFLQPIRMVLNLVLSGTSIFYEFHINFFALINLIYVVAAIIIMYKGYQNLTTPRTKKQVALVLWGIRVSVGLYAIAFLLPKLFPIQASDTIVYFFTILALLIGAGSIAWSIIKYQFLDISLRISRGFLFSICSGLLVGAYMVIYHESRKIIPTILGFDLPIMEVLFIILVVVFFQPILSAIESLLNNLFGKDKFDYQNVLQTLSHDILTIMELDKLKEKITSTLTESMMLENVHLIVENAEANFEVDCIVDDDLQKFIFFKNGDFINVMRNLETPVGFDELNNQISDEEEIDFLNKLNCYLLMPLSHRGDLNGVLCLGNKLTRTTFSAEDATLLNVLSDQIAIALENIELYEDKLVKQRIEEEISVAREIQQMLLPNSLPKGKHFEISAMNIPSKEVGGDYYDFIQFDERKIGIAIGDIAGKGIPGAILMSNLQAAFRASAWQHRDPVEVMEKINNQIVRTTSAEKYATFFYGIFDTHKLTFTFTNAGHNFPIIKKETGDHCFLSEGGLIIGVQPDFKYQSTTVKLKPGDTIVFYTDGITEALNLDVEEFGEQQLINIVLNFPFRTAEELRNHIYEEMMQFTRGTAQYDDLTLIVLRIL
ncbi:PP2C family protein-serine/threonine phosphatase [candidate division KSB1 bacterium]|nr:PP2C family protein-serine/threonine phosphatase [candidate division KSB1 bacterium]